MKVKIKLDMGAEVNPMLLQIYKHIETEGAQMRKTAKKLCGYGETNIPVVQKIIVKCTFCDAEDQLKFYNVKTDSKTVLGLQTYKSLRIIQILNKVKLQKQHHKIEDKMQQMEEMNQK